MIDEREELQSLFDKALNHVRAQGRPSLNCNGGCLYQTDDGRGCAAAPFITQYHPGMEHQGFTHVASKYPYSVDPVARKHSGFITDLQSAHDEAAGEAKNTQQFLELFEIEMHKIANRRHLADLRPLTDPNQETEQ